LFRQLRVQVPILPIPEVPCSRVKVGDKCCRMPRHKDHAHNDKTQDVRDTLHFEPRGLASTLQLLRGGYLANRPV